MVRGILVDMRLRDSSFDPKKSDTSHGAAAPGEAAAKRPLVGPDGVRRWRVTGSHTVLKIVGAIGFAAATVVLAGDVVGAAAGGVATVALAGFALRDLVVPVRLAADREGVTVVVGFAGRRRLPWSAVERVRVDERQRLGGRSRLLEIDTGGSLHLFSGSELGAPVEEVVAELHRLRTGAK